MIAPLPFLEAVSPVLNSEANNKPQFTFDLNTNCCSIKNIRNRRVTYHAPIGSATALALGGTFKTDEKSWLTDCLKSCCSWLCCQSPANEAAYTEEQANTVANKMIIKWLVGTYGIVCALAAIEANSQNGKFHNPYNQPEAPLHTKDIERLKNASEKMHKVFEPFYREVVHHVRTPPQSHLGEEGSKSAKLPRGQMTPSLSNKVSGSPIETAVVPAEELKAEDELVLPANPLANGVGYMIQLPENIQKSFSLKGHKRSPADCLALIQAIEEGTAAVIKEKESAQIAHVVET